MAIESGSHIIVSLVDEPPQQADILRADWPAHITLLQWFGINDVDSLKSALKLLADTTAPSNHTVGDVELFGPSATIPVNVMRDEAFFKGLHETLADLALTRGAVFQEPEWMQDNYRPHITRSANGDHNYEAGNEITINNFCLAQLTSPETARIIEIYQFGTQEA